MQKGCLAFGLNPYAIKLIFGYYVISPTDGSPTVISPTEKLMKATFHPLN